MATRPQLDPARGESQSVSGGRPPDRAARASLLIDREADLWSAAMAEGAPSALSDHDLAA